MMWIVKLMLAGPIVVISLAIWWFILVGIGILTGQIDYNDLD